MSAQERREAIVAATMPLLAQHGAAVTTKQIAHAAGIAEGTIFRVFPDKRALLQAVAEDVMNPPTGRDDMALYLAEVADLREAIVLVVQRLVARMEQGMLVMMALRSVFLTEGRHDDAVKPGPPAFVVESNRQLLANLTDLLFAPHADRLRVPPGRAALVLRSLVFGAWHPGMPSGEHALTPEQVADVVLHGLAEKDTP